MNSWEKSDSLTCPLDDPLFDYEHSNCCESCPAASCDDNLICSNFDSFDYAVGKNDRKLMMSLAKSGTDHAKFRRMIIVYVDITAPLYWWKEFDTYKVGTVVNSCSTMHKIADKEFTLEDFSHEHLIIMEDIDDGDEFLAAVNVDGEYCLYTPKGFLKMTCDILNNYRKKFLEANDKKYWWQMIQLLPSSYNQKRTVMLNYEVLANIYKSRKNHKLDEWRELCDWIKDLPVSEVITLEVEGGNENEK